MKKYEKGKKKIYLTNEAYLEKTNVRKPMKKEYRRMSSEIKNRKCSNGKDNNGIGLFLE